MSCKLSTLTHALSSDDAMLKIRVLNYSELAFLDTSFSQFMEYRQGFRCTSQVDR